jgi:hypothetical protein
VQIYSEDVVCLRTNPKKVGLVAHVPWESDSEDGEDDWFGDDDDEEEGEEGDEEGDEGGAEGSQGEDGDEDDGEGDVAEGSDDGAVEGEGEDEDEEEDDGTKVEVTWLAKNPWDEPSDTLEEPGELQVIDRYNPAPSLSLSLSLNSSPDLVGPRQSQGIPAG